MSFWHRVCYWGTREEEIAAAWPCDARAQPSEVSYFRGIDVDAAPERVFRWLCQLKVAPYSYDWIDNLGRRSPRSLTPGAGALASGQRFMQIFRLAAFEEGRYLTLETRPSRWTGQTLVTYQSLPRDGGTRLLARLRVVYPAPPLGWLGRIGLPLGDWIMMRKQLLTLKALAEGEAGGRDDAD